MNKSVRLGRGEVCCQFRQDKGLFGLAKILDVIWKAVTFPYRRQKSNTFEEGKYRLGLRQV